MTPTATFIDQLWDDFNERHSWLSEAGEQCRKWREEDRANPPSEDRAGREPSRNLRSVSALPGDHRISQGGDHD